MTAAGGPVVEIRTYRLRSGTAETFDQLFREAVVPLLHRYGMDVVGCGRSLADDDYYVLVRRFPSVAEHAAQTERFYGSDDWRRGPREPMLRCIESLHEVVIPEAGDIVSGLG